MLDRRLAILTLVSSLLIACSGQNDDNPSDAGAGSGRGGAGGAGGAGGKAPGLLPNLSTAGKSANGGTGGVAPSPEQCRFAELAPCVSSALDEAVDCLHAGRVGTFSQDRTSCSFSEAGATVQFTEPVRRGSQGFQLSFELKVGDRTCLRFVERNAEDPYVDHYELETESHSIVYLHGFERRLECDGDSYDYDASDLSACPASSKLELPMPLVMDNVAGDVTFEFARPGRIARVFLCNAP